MLIPVRVDTDQYIAMKVWPSNVVEYKFEQTSGLSLLYENDTARLIASLVIPMQPLVKKQNFGAQIAFGKCR
jgi:hypothetical protein